MSQHTGLSAAEVECLQDHLERNRQYGGNDGGIWTSLEEAPDDAVTAVVEAIEAAVAAAPTDERYLRSRNLVDRIDADAVPRTPTATWVGRVCGLLADEPHDYRVDVASIGPERGRTGTKWRVRLRNEAD